MAPGARLGDTRARRQAIPRGAFPGDGMREFWRDFVDLRAWAISIEHAAERANWSSMREKTGPND